MKGVYYDSLHGTASGFFVPLDSSKINFENVLETFQIF